jgi:hypothetical protein
MAHPYRHLGGKTGKKWRVNHVLMENSEPVFTFRSGGNLATELVSYGLHPVADAQHREVAFVNVGWCKRCVLIVDAGWSSGEYEALGLQGGDSIPGSIVRHNLTVHSALSHPACDDPTVLRAEVNDYHRLLLLPGLLRLCSRLLSSSLLGNLEIGGNLDIIADGNAMAILFAFVSCQGLTPTLDQRLTPWYTEVKQSPTWIAC